tara:strand:- start:346 stop:1584 length:1239 start_codon:yes stop_codon:yes gene_type:complete
LALAGLLSACSTIDDLFDQPIEPPRPQVAEPARTNEARSLGRIGDYNRYNAPPPLPVAPPPPLGSQTGDRSVGGDTGGDTAPGATLVGKKVAQIRGDLGTLQRSLQTQSSQFQQLRGAAQKLADRLPGTAAGIDARLQADKTPGNSALRPQSAEVRAMLAEMSENGLLKQELRSRIAAGSVLAGSLAEQVQETRSLAGAVAEDRRQLSMLDGEINEAALQSKRLLMEIDTDIRRQSSYVARGRRDPTTLAQAIKSGEPNDPSLPRPPRRAAPAVVSRAVADSVPMPPARPRTPVETEASTSRQKVAARASSGKPQPSRTPVIVIHFDSADVKYEQALYAAISDAVARDPTASFEVVAVSAGGRPGASIAAAKRQARQVVRSLINMGVPQARLKASAQTTQQTGADQVHIYQL